MEEGSLYSECLFAWHLAWGRASIGDGTNSNQGEIPVEESGIQEGKETEGIPRLQLTLNHTCAEQT